MISYTQIKFSDSFLGFINCVALASLVNFVFRKVSLGDAGRIDPFGVYIEDENELEDEIDKENVSVKSKK